MTSIPGASGIGSFPECGSAGGRGRGWVVHLPIGKTRTTNARTSDGNEPSVDAPWVRPIEPGATTMLPDPLHPAIVHFPVVLAFLLPLFAAGAMWAIRRGAKAGRAWLIPLAGAAALAASTWAAVETGESQSERVEHVVAERPLDTHEESAELLLTLSAGLAVVAAIGLAGGRIGGAARLITTAGALALVVVATRVGHSGGQLVYRYGAASAYSTTAGGASEGTHEER